MAVLTVCVAAVSFVLWGCLGGVQTSEGVQHHAVLLGPDD